MKIGDKINGNMQLQEFVERALSMVFEMALSDETIIESICDEMSTTEEETWYMFNELGYDRYEGLSEDGVDGIVRILMGRDGLTCSDAREMVEECQRRLKEEALETGDYELAIEIVEEELGLEPDYMVDLL